MNAITRQLLAELTGVFLAALAGLTAMMLIGGVIREAIGQSLPPWQVIRLIPYILPDALRFTVPVTLLLATTTVYSRMAAGNEIVALKALGIHPLKLFWPAVAFGFLISLATVWLNDAAVSWGRAGAQRVVVEAAEEIIYSVLQARHGYTSPEFSIVVKHVDGRRLVRPTISVQARPGTPAITITAEEAEIRTDRQAHSLWLRLRNGTVEVEGDLSVRFPDVYEREIPLAAALRGESGAVNPWTLPLCQLPKATRDQEDTILGYRRQMAAEAGCQMLCGDFQRLTAAEWDRRKENLAGMQSQLRRLHTEPHRRWSAGFSCLCFVLIGAPMAVRLRNRDFLTSFFVCFLPILIVYYPLLMYGINAAKNGTLPPPAVWMGNVVLVLWGLWVFRKVLRY